MITDQQQQQQQQNTQELAKPETKIDPRYGIDPTYLSPPSWYTQIEHKEQYMFNGEGKKGRRKIYNKVEYTDFEKQGMKNFLEYLQEKQFQLPPNWDSVDTLKMCYSARFDHKECFKKLQNYIKWLSDPTMHNISDISSKLLKNGFIYVHGRDKQLRPVIVLDVTKLTLDEAPEELIRSVSVILDMVKKYMFRPYHIENWVMIIDLADRGVFSLPIGKLKAIVGSMSVNYCATLEKMFILNPPWIVKKGWGMVEGMLDPETAAKIRMITKNDLNQIREQIDESMLEQKYGGTQPNITSNYWPPKDLFAEERQKDLKIQLDVQLINQTEQQKNEFLPTPRKENLVQQEPSQQLTLHQANAPVVLTQNAQQQENQLNSTNPDLKLSFFERQLEENKKHSLVFQNLRTSSTLNQTPKNQQQEIYLITPVKNQSQQIQNNSHETELGNKPTQMDQIEPVITDKSKNVECTCAIF